MPIPDSATPVVVAYAHYGADAGALADEFRTQCERTFGSKSINLGQDPLTDSYLLSLKQQGLTYPQIFDRYRHDHPDWFPWIPDDPEYEQKREEAIDVIKKRVRRLKSNLNKAIERVDRTTQP